MEETYIYNIFIPEEFSPNQKVGEVNISKIFFSKHLIKIAKVLAISGSLILAISFFPSFWYWAKTKGNEERISKIIAETVESTPKTLIQGAPTTPDVRKLYRPRFDPTFPSQSWLKIASIGVDTQIQEATFGNLEDALKKGVWRAPDFGTPSGQKTPIILAAHRYGYLAWSNLYRRKNSFYNLPKLKAGDTVEIVWRQRKYLYEIYYEAKGEEIPDYSADLILYTCESLNSPVRIFKYGRLLVV